MSEILSVMTLCFAIIAGVFWKMLFDTKKDLKRVKEQSRQLEIEEIREKAAARDIDDVIRDANIRWSGRRKDSGNGS